MEQISLKKHADPAPEYPACFHLLGTPEPLAGVDDTYWIAPAVWNTTQSTYDGFLLYADKAHYVFLDQEEAASVTRAIVGQSQTNVSTRTFPMKGTRANALPDTHISAQDAPRLSTRVAGLLGLPLQFLALSFRWRLLTTLIACVFGLGVYQLRFPATFLGIVWLVPIILASWGFRWRGYVLSASTITLVLGSWYIVAFGRAFWASPWAMPLLLEMLAGWFVGLVIAGLRHMTDVLLATYQQNIQAQQAYRQEYLKNEWKDQALQSLEHELRTPLTHVQGYLELLELSHERLDEVTRADYLQQAQQGCKEILSLITTALEATSAPEAQHPPFKTFSLRHEIQTVLAHFDPRVLEAYDFHLEIPDADLVFADQRFVRQILRNLLMNAVKYTDPLTRVTIRAEPMREANVETGHICVRVQDQGPGIPPEQQSQLFQKFVRLSHARSELIQGSGLGLFICKQLVEVMGGHIWIESTGQPGKGCCFAFTLASAMSTDAMSFPQIAF